MWFNLFDLAREQCYSNLGWCQSGNKNNNKHKEQYFFAPQLRGFRGFFGKTGLKKGHVTQKGLTAGKYRGRGSGQGMFQDTRAECESLPDYFNVIFKNLVHA